MAAGARSFRRLALTSAADAPATPCGMCRQALAEFGLDLESESLGQGGTRTTWTLAELLPDSFELEDRFRGPQGEVGGAS